MNSFRENIITMLDRQIEKGKSKYGLPLEENNMSLSDRLEHLEQELVDALFYCQWLRQWYHNSGGLTLYDICAEARMLCTTEQPLAKAIYALARAQDAVEHNQHQKVIDELAEAVLYIAEVAGYHGNLGETVCKLLAQKRMANISMRL